MIFRKIKKSFSYAFEGFKFFVKERNIKIHFGAALLAILLGIIFGITLIEWVAVVISISLVISLEILNTVTEDLIDLLYHERNGKVMIIKDLSAAAVFIAALGSFIVGLLIFTPYILRNLQ